MGYDSDAPIAPVTKRVVVGVNRFSIDGEEPYQPFHVEPAIQAEQAEQAGKRARLKEQRDKGAFGRAIAALKKAAESETTPFTRPGPR